ncbi:glycosyltransferase [Mycobacterium tuberculosis]|nr:glycosyltransferase [Mycobacterium tuberculosis]
MKFVLAVHGTRGDVEPCAAVGVELRRRGHAVHMAVPPNLIEFVESAGLTGVAYGPDSDEQINTVAAFVRNLTRAQNPLNLARAVKELFVEGWAEMGTTLTTLADGADLVIRARHIMVWQPTSPSTTTFRLRHCITFRCRSTAKSRSRRYRRRRLWCARR